MRKIALAAVLMSVIAVAGIGIGFALGFTGTVQSTDNTLGYDGLSMDLYNKDGTPRNSIVVFEGPEYTVDQNEVIVMETPDNDPVTTGHFDLKVTSQNGGKVQLRAWMVMEDQRILAAIKQVDLVVNGIPYSMIAGGGQSFELKTTDAIELDTNRIGSGTDIKYDIYIDVWYRGVGLFLSDDDMDPGETTYGFLKSTDCKIYFAVYGSDPVPPAA
jgi:hypothetical protein